MRSLGGVTSAAHLRSRAAYAFQGPTDADMARLVEGMRTGDDATRRYCCQAVVQTGSGTPQALAALALGVGDTQPHVVAVASQALGKLGNKARSVAPALRDAVVANRRNPVLCNLLLGRLLSVGLDADMVTDAFRALEDSGNKRIRNVVRRICQNAR